jgi:hypothetical protein
VLNLIFGPKVQYSYEEATSVRYTVCVPAIKLATFYGGIRNILPPSYKSTTGWGVELGGKKTIPSNHIL